MDTTSAPLADYFWIAGIDSLSYSGSAFLPPSTNGGGPPSPSVDTTIEEGSEGEGAAPSQSAGASTARSAARHSRTNSWNRLSKLSIDARNSILALEESGTPDSNRSSVTIKAPTNGNGRDSLTDFDFDSALIKFANQRESFLDDLSFSAGLPAQTRPPMTNTRADRIRIEEGDILGSTARRSPLRSVGGSIRRKMSFRDMNSMKRQPSLVQRTGKREFLIKELHFDGPTVFMSFNADSLR
jgi:hypothetical protein